MLDGKNEHRVAVTARRFYPVLLTTLVFAISGCTTVGLGQTALSEGRYAEAASNFEAALEEHPDRTDALIGLGIARYQQTSYDDAVAHLSRAVSRNPKRPDAQLYLGLSYLQRGDEGSAAEHLRAFRDLTRSARVAEQVDDALRLMRTEHSLPRESRHFIAVSLESAMKSEQALQDARWGYAPGPSYDYYDPYAWGWRW